MVLAMRIEKLELFHIRMPLRFTFKTSQAGFNCRETIVIKATDELGNEGYGEVVAFHEPFYTKETLPIAKSVLKKVYIPQLIHQEMKHPFDIHQCFDLSYPMAISGLENALVDLYAKRQRKPVTKLIFDEETNDEILAGVVLGDHSIPSLLSQISREQREGYNRFKIKIKPEDGYAKLQAVRDRYPDIELLADANKSYSPEQMAELKKMDEVQLLCIEEPLNTADLHDYQILQKELKTPVCLDESIQTIENLQTAISLKALSVINIKAGRVGGLYYVKQMIKLCRENNIRYWIGSMLESGVSKMLHVHLASLKDTFIPGDLSSSKRYFAKDIIKPEIMAENGRIKVPKGYGTGVEINEPILNAVTIDYIKAGDGIV